MTYDITEISAFMQRIAVEAGEFVSEARRSSGFETSLKAARNFVTSADKTAESFLVKSILEKYPGHHILSEEDNPEIEDNSHFFGPLWIIDPIDGTTNFARGHAHVGISIAFADRGKTLAGVVNAPFLDELFTAVSGKGARINGEKIQVSGADELISALVGTGFPYERDHLNVERLTARIQKVLLNCGDIRRAGAASLDICWVACGRLDLYYETTKAWDMAAAALIAREAGAQVRSFDESLPNWAELIRRIPQDLYSNDLIVGNKTLVDKMFQLFAES